MRIAPALIAALMALCAAAPAAGAALRDSDRDGLSNRAEKRAKTNPRKKDTDRDGLTDGVEVRQTRTSPRRKDTDRDLWTDGRELRLGSNPRNRRDRPKKPDTKIASAPKAVSASSASAFSFQASVPVARFECQIDGAAWKGCPGTPSFGVADGAHKIAVRAVNAEGWRDPTPASYAWSTDTAAPVVRISSAPSPFLASTSATFRFDASEKGATLECRRDAGAWRACTSPVTESSLSQGAHTFAVRGRDAAGNSSPAAATNAFTVDTIAPDTTVTAVPNSSGVGPFVFHANEAATFECRVDSGAWAACSSPKTYSGLSRGSHSFRVRARDLAGHLDSSPPRVSFRIG